MAFPFWAWLVFFGLVATLRFFLVITGLRLLRCGGGGETDPQNYRMLRLFRRVLPVTEDYRAEATAAATVRHRPIPCGPPAATRVAV